MVAALLGVWWVIGSGTVDDGYIAGIVRGRGDNGFVGNVYRWLDAPEAPFGWFYEPYHWWSTISAVTPWMRLPSTLLGLLCWFLVSRLLLPRLGRAGRLRATPWVRTRSSTRRSCSGPPRGSTRPIACFVTRFSSRPGEPARRSPRCVWTPRRTSRRRWRDIWS